MRKVNILFVITKLELGGAQKQLFHLIRNLDRTKYNIFLFTAEEGLLLWEFLSIKGLVLERSFYLERPLNPLKDLLALLEIYQYIQDKKIDIIHTHSSKAGILGRAAGRMAGVKRMIHSVHGWSFNDFQPALGRIFFSWLERLVSRFTDRFIVVSEHDRQKGIRCGIGNASQYRKIPYGIEPIEVIPEEDPLRKHFGLDSSDRIVAMVACLKPQKAPLDFIRLASLVTKKLPLTKFILVGDGLQHSRAQELIRKLNLSNNVILTGWRRDVPRLLPSIDVFVLTSLWEGLPVAALEAMQAGKPIVATNTGGIAEIVREGETAYLVMPHDLVRMSERLLLLLEDAQLRRKMGESARISLGEEFTIPNMAQNTEKIYEELLGDRLESEPAQT